MNKNIIDADEFIRLMSLHVASMKKTVFPNKHMELASDDRHLLHCEISVVTYSEHLCLICTDHQCFDHMAEKIEYVQPDMFTAKLFYNNALQDIADLEIYIDEACFEYSEDKKLIELLKLIAKGYIKSPPSEH